MYSDWVFSVALGFLAGWLLVMSFLIWQQNKFLKTLFPRSGERDIRKKFEEIVKLVDQTETNQKKSLKYIQKVEILRFNPYDDTGGDQSFTVCLLNDEGSGVVITSLHARSGTRVFGKQITNCKSVKYQLSKEEETVIKKAMKI